ncbi:MAG: glycosyltransferase family 2 protein [Bacteroidota bacterium]
MDLSVVIITFNEEKNIQRCIDSVKDIASEILVVDSFSEDQTESIAISSGATFIQHPFEGHIEQKNYAWQQAKHNWILSLDADEALTPQLSKSIKDALKNPTAKGYMMNRLTYYCGHWVKHSGWYPDTKLRLFEKHKGAWGGVNPHDKFELSDPKAKVLHLQGDILHYSYYTKEDHFKQIEYFSKIAASELHQRGVSKPSFMIYLKVAAQFFKNYILKKGFLDGKTGWLIAKRSAFATYRKYTILKELNNG